MSDNSFAKDYLTNVGILLLVLLGTAALGLATFGIVWTLIAWLGPVVGAVVFVVTYLVGITGFVTYLVRGEGNNV